MARTMVSALRGAPFRAAGLQLLRGTGAFALAAGSKDTVLLFNLPTGFDTAVVTGAGGTTGVALVEVHEIQ